MSILQADGTVKVQRGDCLWAIAEDYLGGAGWRWPEIAKLNGISQRCPIIYPGDILKLPTGASSTSKPVNKSNKANISYFGLQAGTDRTVFAAWTWDKSHTENYKTMWYYSTGDGVWFVGTDGTSEYKQSVYSAPGNAKKVKFKVKPISQTYECNEKETSYWTANWSTEEIYDFSNNPPEQPSVPTVKVEKYTLTAELDNLDINATSIEFQVVANDKKVYVQGTAKIQTTKASYSCVVKAGDNYKVRCRGVRDGAYGDWSEYSSNVTTIPPEPSNAPTVYAVSETEVCVERNFQVISEVTSYDIEYTTDRKYFDSSDQTTVVSMSPETNKWYITGLESGREYFFRLRCVNEIGSSAWSKITSIVIGKKPSAPTTWSSSTVVMHGDPVTLHWIHNAEDGSKQTYADLEIYINEEKLITAPIKNSIDDVEIVSSYVINTYELPARSVIKWRARTSGISGQLSDWSVQRIIDVYEEPSLGLRVVNSNDEAVGVIEAFPFYIDAIAEAEGQLPLGYHITIIANEPYETVDQIGNTVSIAKDQSVFSRYIQTMNPLRLMMSANNVDLENNISYTVLCDVSMDSGLVVKNSVDFQIFWTDIEYEPNAEIGVDMTTLVTHIRPYCSDNDGNLIDGVTLSVYRREYDGTFVELATGLDNSKNTYITDPHPSLDYARYRIVAITNDTGAVGYSDLPGYPIGGKAVVIQWDEAWSGFDTTAEDLMESAPWSGSMLLLPYNIDIANDYKPDVSLVEYVGRQHPVTYYGTQIGETASWSVEIPATDIDTLYALRRLARWMGDVYVREPSGSGYWANIVVSFSQTHKKLTIPVKLEITRVEGGA